MGQVINDPKKRQSKFEPGRQGTVTEQPKTPGTMNCMVMFDDGECQLVGLKYINPIGEDEASGSQTADSSAESKINALLQNKMAVKAGNLFAGSGSMDEAPAGTPARPGGVLHRLKRLKAVEESQKKKSRDVEAKREMGFRTKADGNDRSIDEVQQPDGEESRMEPIVGRFKL